MCALMLYAEIIIKQRICWRDMIALMIGTGRCISNIHKHLKADKKNIGLVSNEIEAKISKSYFSEMEWKKIRARYAEPPGSVVANK